MSINLDWPSSLPQKLELSNFEFDLGDGAVSKDMDAGPPLARQRFSAIVNHIKGSITVNEQQVKYFTQFYEATGYGALTFKWNLNLAFIESNLVRFDLQSKPKINALSNTSYRITMALIVLPS